MFEIDNPKRRAGRLSKLGGVERRVAITIAGRAVAAVPEDDVERSTDEGRASSVQFLHFPFTPEQIAAFQNPANRLVIAISHPHYGHMTIIGQALREALAGDFD